MINALQAYPLAAWDDVSMSKLEPEKVIATRKLEIEYANKMKVWKKIPRRMAKERGWRIIKSRWLDINKGDDANPKYRRRFVGKEFNDKAVDGLFAATPPLETLRLLMSWAASCGVAPLGGTARIKEKCILIADVSRAFFEAPARRDVCVELPEEAMERGETTQEVVGKLLASLYGTTDASARQKVHARVGLPTVPVQPVHVHAL